MRTLLALLLSISVSFAADTAPPKLPKQIEAKEYELITVDAETPETKVVFYVVSGEGLAIIPFNKLINQKQLVAIGKAGRYRVIAWTAGKDGPSGASETLIIVKPGDGPAPPDPDDLANSPTYKKLFAGYTAEKDAEKAKKAQLLAKSYRETLDSLKGPSVNTAGDVFNTAASFRRQNVGDALPLVREIAGESIGAIIGDDPAKAITKEQRTAVQDQFLLLAVCLERIGK